MNIGEAQRRSGLPAKTPILDHLTGVRLAARPGRYAARTAIA